MSIIQNIVQIQCEGSRDPAQGCRDDSCVAKLRVGESRCESEGTQTTALGTTVTAENLKLGLQ